MSVRALSNQDHSPIPDVKQSSNSDHTSIDKGIRVDSIWQLINIFNRPMDKLKLDGVVKKVKKTTFVPKYKCYVLRFLLGDDTDSIWCCLWEEDDFYPFHLDCMQEGDHLEVTNCSFVYSNTSNKFELVIHSFDDISFLYI